MDEIRDLKTKIDTLYCSNYNPQYDQSATL